MSAYLVLIRESEITDEAARAAYLAAAGPAQPPADLTALAYYGDVEPLEGEPPSAVVMFEFPDAAAARQWYFDPAYQARVPLRRRSAAYRGFIVDGLAAGGPREQSS